MVRLNTQNVNSEDDIGNNRPLPGRYHAIIQAVDESFDKHDKIIVEFQVLAGTVPGQEQKTITEYFATTPKAISRLQRLAFVTGLLPPNAPEQDVSFTEAVGRQLVIEVEEHEYVKDGNNIKGVRLSFHGMWSVGHPAVADVPKNRAALGYATGKIPPVAPVSQLSTTSGNRFADL